MANLIQNSTLNDWQHVRYFTDQEGKTGTIEAPAHWEFVYIPKESDPNKIPQSLHRDNGFVISAGYRKWEAGYQQSNLQLKAGTRYQLKARLKADVNFPGGQAPDLTAITWRFTVESDDEILHQDWAMTTHQQAKQTEDFYYIFDAEEGMTVSITFWARSFYAGNDCDFWLYDISLIPVEKTNAIVDKLGTPSIVTTTEEIAADVIETALNKVETTIPVVNERSLNDVKLTIEEIDMIAGALRSLGVSSSDSNVSNGLNKLAEVLERLK
ncbi:MAG: hypothetical protein AAF846_10655 [Chloroflexota bacterium]